MTPSMSKFLDRDMDIALRKANFMAREANYNEQDVIHFLRVQMERSYNELYLCHTDLD